jgi:hypothetical protein
MKVPRGLFLAFVLSVTATAGMRDALNSLVFTLTMEAMPLEESGLSAKAGVGALSLDTAPWTRVEIDGELRGTTPLYKLRLLPGKHIVKMINEEHHVAQESSVEVSGGYVTKVKGALATSSEVSSVESKSSPNATIDQNNSDLVNNAFVTIDAQEWSRVLVDGKPVGTTPLFKLRVSSGTHVIQVLSRADNALSQEVIECVPGENRKVFFQSK